MSLLCLKSCTWFFSALCQQKAMDFNRLGYFYSSQREEPDHMFFAFSSGPSLLWLPYSLFIILLFFPFQSLSNCSLQGSGWDEVLFLPREINARSYLSLMLQVSTCCSYMGQGVDPFLYEHRKWGKSRNPHAGIWIAWNKQQQITSSLPLQLDESTRWKIT